MTLDPYNAFLHRVETRGRLARRRQGRDRRGGHADDGGVEDPRPRARARRRVRRSPPGGRSGRRREAEHARVRVRRAHEQPALRPGAQPLGSRAHDREARAAAAARPSPPASSTSRSAPTRPAPSGSRPRSAGSPATGRPRASFRTRASFRSHGPSTRSARWRAPRRSAGGRWRSWPGARSTGGRRPADRPRHQAVRGGRPRSRRRLRGSGPRAARHATSRSSSRCSTRSRRSRSWSCSRRRPPPTSGWLRTRLADYGADVRARLLAGLLLPSTPTSPGSAPGAGYGRCGSASSAASTCWWRRRCRSSRRAWTPSRPTTGC